MGSREAGQQDPALANMPQQGAETVHWSQPGSAKGPARAGQGTGGEAGPRIQSVLEEDIGSSKEQVTPKAVTVAVRIVERFGLEGTFKGHLVQPRCNEQGHLQLDQVAQSPVQPGLECFQGWSIYHLSGQPVPVFHHPQCKEFLPYT
ncbi:hypothetical protein QYF61_008595 [Mycteria americana]|uniref:Uncharacterized protein n=1 Tax=Mycteria americana TaxID=33587 RepID=A0AAN7NFL1_MYCAM|nr:hypothetical protein QYF61_008595 [Mycteria americana]